jgi:hypothetical protein
VTVDKLKWGIYLYSLFTDIYNSDEIFIDVLTLDLNAIQSNNPALALEDDTLLSKIHTKTTGRPC